MAEKEKNKRPPQMSLEEYNKIKEKKAQSKLKLHFPWPVKFFLIFPATYLIFLLAYFLFHIRFTAEH